MDEQNPDCDVNGCRNQAAWILLADIEDADSLLCLAHLRRLERSDPLRASLFGPLNEIVIRQPLSSPPAGENA
jgi:hypothetical protein